MPTLHQQTSSVRLGDESGGYQPSPGRSESTIMRLKVTEDGTKGLANGGPRIDPAVSLKQTAVIIPVRNEEDSLPHVLQDLPAVGFLIVVDNGSSDSTARRATEAGCHVVWEPTAGYGRACLAGIKALDEGVQSGDVDIRYVAFLDGDYSDHPEQLSRLLMPIAQDQADFVIGSRMLGDRESGAMPPQAVWGNRLACFLMRRIWKANYSDLGPFRVIRLNHLRQLAMEDVDFGWTVEMQVKGMIAGLRCVEVPVSYRRRIGVSKISGTISGTIRAGYKILFTIAKYAWKTHRKGGAFARRDFH